MEADGALKKEGLVREIAVSNMTIPKLEAILPLCEIPPFANEMELHPSFQQPELYSYCKSHNMEIIGFCPLGSPNRPERDRTEGISLILKWRLFKSWPSNTTVRRRRFASNGR